jgi:polyhydroxyalkanoate synthase
MYHRILKSNQLSQGYYEGADFTVRIADITVPVLVLGGSTDGIAPIAAVRPLVDLLPRSHEVRFEVVPGGHLGMLTGRAARGTTWPIIEEWVAQHSAPDKPTGRGGRAPKPGPASEPDATAPASGAKRAAKVAPQRSTIGSNPARRYDSQSSRDLHRKG